MLSTTNQSSTLCRAQGVLRRKVRLDLTLGLWRKQRCRSISVVTMVSSVTRCSGSQGWDEDVGITAEGYEQATRPSKRR
jgi:hypothetical protein